MGERCYYVYDRDVGRVLIPGCMGAAVYGRSGCTCRMAPITPKKAADIEERLAGVEATLAAILERLPAQHREKSHER
jgi:hypothetical protein